MRRNCASWKPAKAGRARLRPVEAVTLQREYPADCGVNSRMKLSQKVKIALEETRILILGAQVLLGFGFRGVFNDGFEQLPMHARYIDGVGLALLVCVVALLIAPGP